MKDVIIDFERYRIFQRESNLIVEFDARLIYDNGIVDVITKQLLVTNDPSTPFETVRETAESMIANWQISQLEG